MPNRDLYRYPQIAQGAYVQSRGDFEGNTCVVPPEDGIAYHQFLTLANDGVTWNLNGNYSAAATSAYSEMIAPTDIYSFLIAISDDAKLLQTGWGAGAALTNGMSLWVYLKRINASIPLLQGLILKKNCDWYSLTAEVNHSDFFGTAQTLAIEVDINKRFGKPLNMQLGDRFIAVLHDDFTGLTQQTMSLGCLVSITPEDLVS